MCRSGISSNVVVIVIANLSIGGIVVSVLLLSICGVAPLGCLQPVDSFCATSVVFFKCALPHCCPSQFGCSLCVEIAGKE